MNQSSAPAMGGFHIRPYRPGDERSINEGFNTVFGHNRTLDEWRWKFQPDHDGCAIMVAVDEEETVLAQYAATVSNLHLEQTTLKIGQIVDAFSLPQAGTVQHRVFIKTTNAFYDHFGSPEIIPLFYGFPGERHLKLGRLKLGYNAVHAVHIWQRKLAWRYARRSPYTIRTGYSKTNLNQLWHRARFRHSPALVRDAAWMHRRYLSHPSREYTFVSAWTTQMHAHAVVHVHGTSAQWLDVLWDGENPQALIALEIATCRLLRRQGARHCVLWLRGDTTAEKVFLKQKWTRTLHPDRLYFGLLSYHPELTASDLLERFYYTLGDSDLA